MIEKLFLVSMGGAIGAALRFLSVTWISRMMGEVAYGTIFVNVVGSFVMGVAAIFILDRMPDGAARLAPFVLTGILGGFTTFSAFSLDALRLFESDRVLLALAYISASVVLSIAGLVLGAVLARNVFG